MNRAAAVRWSLLVAMGIAPVACSGTTEPGPNTTMPSTCTDPKTDPQTGLVTCSEGYSHRPKAGACEIVGGAPGEGGAGDVVEPGQLPRAKGIENCADDPSICRAFAYGYCTFVEEVDVDPGYVCHSGCMEDTDCGTGGVCVCSGPTNHGGECKYGACKSDADCDDGLLCASYTPICGTEVAFACHRPDDECRSDADCPEGVGCTIQSEHRTCADGFVCGRPFLVDAAMRMAPSSFSNAWTSPDAAVPSVDHLTTSERLTLAEHWTKMGRMEHASIAAFARFSLQLLALGAPPELVQACTAALADETAHTQLCFGIASAYAGRAIGPGPLDIAGSLDVTSLGDIVDLVIAEGCFGETGAALEALEAADSAFDPVIVAAYSRIAADEQRHAELGFRFVRWALERDHDQVTNRIRAALADGENLPELVRRVAVPCLEALLATDARSAA